MELVVPTPKGIITKPGCYDLSFEEYRGQIATDLCLSPSEAFVLKDNTPQHLLYKWNYPSEPTKAARMGTAIHALVLQPDMAEKTFAVADGNSWNAKEAKLVKADAILNCLIPLLTSEYDDAQRAAESARNNPEFKEWLTDYKAETSWFMSIGGKLRARVRPDRWGNDWRVMDVKSVEHSDDHFIQTTMRNHGWFMSAPFQCSVIESVAQHEVEDFVFGVIERNPPYICRIVRPGQATMMQGMACNQRVLKDFITCAETGVWPAYKRGIAEMDMNAGALMQLEREHEDEAKKIEQAPINFEGVNF